MTEATPVQQELDYLRSKLFTAYKAGHIKKDKLQIGMMAIALLLLYDDSPALKSNLPNFPDREILARDARTHLSFGTVARLPLGHLGKKFGIGQYIPYLLHLNLDGTRNYKIDPDTGVPGLKSHDKGLGDYAYWMAQNVAWRVSKEDIALYEYYKNTLLIDYCTMEQQVQFQALIKRAKIWTFLETFLAMLAATGITVLTFGFQAMLMIAAAVFAYNVSLFHKMKNRLPIKKRSRYLTYMMFFAVGVFGVVGHLAGTPLLSNIGVISFLCTILGPFALGGITFLFSAIVASLPLIFTFIENSKVRKTALFCTGFAIALAGFATHDVLAAVLALAVALPIFLLLHRYKKLPTDKMLKMMLYASLGLLTIFAAVGSFVPTPILGFNLALHAMVNIAASGHALWLGPVIGIVVGGIALLFWGLQKFGEKYFPDKITIDVEEAHFEIDEVESKIDALHFNKKFRDHHQGDSPDKFFESAKSHAELTVINGSFGTDTVHQFIGGAHSPATTTIAPKRKKNKAKA